MTPLKATHHGENFPFTGTPPSLPSRLKGIKKAGMDAKSTATASPPATLSSAARHRTFTQHPNTVFRRGQTTQRSSRSRWRSTDARQSGDHKEIGRNFHHNVSSCATNTHFGCKAALNVQYKFVKRAGQSHQFPLIQTPPLPTPRAAQHAHFQGYAVVHLLTIVRGDLEIGLLVVPSGSHMRTRDGQSGSSAQGGGGGTRE